MSDRTLRATRVVSVIAATVIALASGTNYIYSAWGPQFAERMKLSSTQSNLVGIFGNLGTYVSGIPFGLLVDSKGPKPGVIIGGCLMGAGYFALHRTFESGPGSVNMAGLCIFNLFTGMGAASAFSGSIKTSAHNWPSHRGTATAFPVAAFGLGAFFFASISSLAFPDKPSSFLLLLSIGCLCMCFGSVFFMRMVPPSSMYSAVPTSEEASASNSLQRTDLKDRRLSTGKTPQEPGGSASLISSSLSSIDDPCEGNDNESAGHHDLHCLDIRGLALFRQVKFYQLWVLLGLLTGIGLMTINNIGNDARALWIHFDNKTDPAFVQKTQLKLVMLLSVLSCVGRLLSGIGSDIIVKKLHGSRFWCLFISSAVFTIAQLCATQIENPHFLGVVSGITGLGYGFLYGVYPALVAESFGIRGLSQNWGVMSLSSVLIGNFFNISYGRIFDHHSFIHDNERVCLEGLDCYRVAYYVTAAVSFFALVISSWSIKYDSMKKSKAGRDRREESREA